MKAIKIFKTLKATSKSYNSFLNSKSFSLLIKIKPNNDFLEEDAYFDLKYSNKDKSSDLSRSDLNDFNPRRRNNEDNEERTKNRKNKHHRFEEEIDEGRFNKHRLF